MKRKGKNPARLVLFFTSSFVIILLLAFTLKFLEFRIGEVRAILMPPGTSLPGLIAALQWALVPAFYGSILLSLSYTSRRAIPIPLSVFTLLILSLAAVLCVSFGLDRLKKLPAPPAASAPAVFGEKGLILSRSGAAMILLRGPAEPQGPRVVSLPGQPLIFQEVPLGPNNTILPLPPLPFRDETPPGLASLFIDFSLTARQIEDRMEQGFLSLAAYAGALILLLVSLRFVLDIGSWPLASLFLGALAFRGVLALETFTNTLEIQELLASFLGKALPPAFISPLVFAALGLLILVYTFLIHLVKPRRAGDA